MLLTGTGGSASGEEQLLFDVSFRVDKQWSQRMRYICHDFLRNIKIAICTNHKLKLRISKIYSQISGIRKMQDE